MCVSAYYAIMKVQIYCLVYVAISDNQDRQIFLSK